MDVVQLAVVRILFGSFTSIWKLKLTSGRIDGKTQASAKICKRFAESIPIAELCNLVKSLGLLKTAHALSVAHTVDESG